MTCLSLEKANELFEYKDGNLYWKAFSISNNRTSSKVGRIAGSSTGHGYLKIGYNKKSIYIHQIVFLLHHGYIPEMIDHIDGNTMNNKIENLRPASKISNSYNSKIRKDNTSGVKGVTWHCAAKKWMASIYANKQYIYLGLFDSLETAKKVVDAKRRELHQEFANTGNRRAA